MARGPAHFTSFEGTWHQIAALNEPREKRDWSEDVLESRGWALEMCREHRFRVRLRTTHPIDPLTCERGGPVNYGLFYH